MSSIQIFPSLGGTTASDANGYVAFGFPRNPFREPSGVEDGPLYTGHITAELQNLQRWVNDVHELQIRQPLSLVGAIGSGKTRILSVITHSLEKVQVAEKMMVSSMRLQDTGYARASIGAMLVLALENTNVPFETVSPTGNVAVQSVLPVVRAIMNAEVYPQPHDVLSNALHRVRNAATATEKDELGSFVSRWLQRQPLTPAQERRVGLSRRIDWEGELLPVLASLLRLAVQTKVLRTCFLFVDQLEDLFRDNYSEMRRARLLTDLRGLVDEIDAGAPIGLLLAWTPDFRERPMPSHFNQQNQVEALLRVKYDALFTRMQRRRVDLALLAEAHAEPFARTWIDYLRGVPGFDANRQPNITTLVENAWRQLKENRGLFPGDKTTPRILLGELARQVDALVQPTAQN